MGLHGRPSALTSPVFNIPESETLCRFGTNCQEGFRKNRRISCFVLHKGSEQAVRGRAGARRLGSEVLGTERRSTPVVPRYTTRFKYHPTDLQTGAGGEAVPALLSLELLSEKAGKCSPKRHETRPSLLRLGSCTNGPASSTELRRPVYFLLA